MEFYGCGAVLGEGEGVDRPETPPMGKAPSVQLRARCRNDNVDGSHRRLLIGYVGQGHV